MDLIAVLKRNKVAVPRGLTHLLENAPDGVTLQRNSPFPLLDYICWHLPDYFSWPLPYTVQYKNFFIGVADQHKFRRYDSYFPEHVREGVEQAWLAIERAYQNGVTERSGVRERSASET
ncbi:hypothetical protein HYU22_05240 [Candidatus Woesearchaeota archaeon]|nr:hypothetical protein [Candidatus Woesearchaeota archaeon]